MKTWKRICIKDWSISDQEGNTCNLERGREYTTSGVHDDGSVTVFTRYWVRAPQDIFAGAERFT